MSPSGERSRKRAFSTMSSLDGAHPRHPSFCASPLQPRSRASLGSAQPVNLSKPGQGAAQQCSSCIWAASQKKNLDLSARGSGGTADGSPYMANLLPPQHRCYCSAAVKKLRELDHGGLGAARNPLGAGDPDGPALFSRASISRMMADSAAAWQAMDRAAELAARADEAARPRPPTSSTSSRSSDLPRTCTLWEGSLPASSGIGSAGARAGQGAVGTVTYAPSVDVMHAYTPSTGGGLLQDTSCRAVEGAAQSAASTCGRPSTA